MLRRPAVSLLATAGIASLLLAIPVAWPGFGSWPGRATIYTPADAAGQTFILEFDHPIRIEFPANIASAHSVKDDLTAQVSVLSPSPTAIDLVPVQVDAARSQLEVPLGGMDIEAGAMLRVALLDPAGQVWIESSEHDLYPSGARSVRDQPTGGDLAFRVYYRRTLLDMLLQGFGVALRSWRTIFAAMISIGAAGLLVGGALRRVEGLDCAAHMSAAIGGGLSFMTVVGWAVAALGLSVPAWGVTLLAALIAAAGVSLWSRPTGRRPAFDPGALGLTACVVLIALMRLAFASPLALPPHIDAVEHYAIVTDFLAPERDTLAENQMALLTTQYYHFGFHGLAAWILRLAGDNTPFALLVLGQLLQAAAVAAVYFPVHAATQDKRAAMAAVVLAGIGWTMPAYASNWSRYPALLSLTLLPTAVGLGILACRAHGRSRFLLLAAAGLATATVTLSHTRILFLLAALVISVEGARRLLILRRKRAMVVRDTLVLAVITLIAVALVLLSLPLQRASAWESLGEYVKGQGAVSTVLVICLTPFAVRRHPQAALSMILWIVATLLLLYIPPNASYPLPILDAPLARMALYLPISALGGLGVSGLGSALSSSPLRTSPKGALSGGVLLLGLVYLVWCLSRQAFAPSGPFLIAAPDDLTVALESSTQLGTEARILIPSQAQVNYSARPVDGGAWLPLLAGLQTVLWPADADLTSLEEHQRLCAAGITHVYAGSTRSSYTQEELDFARRFYSPQFIYPNAALYAVIACDLFQP